MQRPGPCTSSRVRSPTSELFAHLSALGPDWITREAYSHEVSSCGFWPGGEAMPYPVFYAYAYPEPEGFSEAAADLGGWDRRSLERIFGGEK